MLTMPSVSQVTHPSINHADCSKTVSRHQTRVIVQIIFISPTDDAQNVGPCMDILTPIGFGQFCSLFLPSVAVTGQTLSNCQI